MRFSQRLEIRQGQSLVMTPQLLQAIKLLQFSSVELASYVEAELERNPLLERADEPDARETAGERPEPDGERGGDSYETASEPFGDSGGAGLSDGAGEGDWGVAEIAPERGDIDVRADSGMDNVFQ